MRWGVSTTYRGQRIVARYATCVLDTAHMAHYAARSVPSTGQRIIARDATRNATGVQRPRRSGA
eukprot:2174565-Rhodomonas_salina.5